MMKRRYQIIRTAGQPDWAAAPRAQIDQLEQCFTGTF